MNFKTMLAAITISSMGLFACNDDAKKDNAVITDADNKVVTTTEVKEGYTSAKTVAVADVPAPIRTSFETKYPKADKVVWMRYEPSWDMSDDAHPEIDTSYYYVNYYNDNMEYINWYNNMGEWVKTETPIEGGSDKLPAAINKVIAANYAGYEIFDIEKENDKNMEMYEVKMRKGDDKVKIKFLPNGEIFKRK